MPSSTILSFRLQRKHFRTKEITYSFSKFLGAAWKVWKETNPSGKNYIDENNGRLYALIKTGISMTQDLTNTPNILVLGSRHGLTSALKKLGYNHFICKNFQEAPPSNLSAFTHVLASGEGTVALANKVRKQLNLQAIDDRVITLCSDKLEMKTAAKDAGIPVTSFLPGGPGKESREIYKALGQKVIVKERNNSGGKGQKSFLAPEEVESLESDLIEGFISGNEMSIESFVQNGEILFTSTTKYHELGIINIVPSALEESLIEEVLDINKRVIEAFDIQFGLTHLEVYLTPNGVLFGEIALRPPGGHIMTLIEKAHGFNPWELYIDLHLKKEISIPLSRGENAAAIIYHPGVGLIERIIGEDTLEELGSLVKLKIKGKVGDLVSPREGVGQERAHFIFTHQDRSILVKEVDIARKCFKMKLL